MFILKCANLRNLDKVYMEDQVNRELYFNPFLIGFRLTEI
jgi:hypothetical protein